MNDPIKKMVRESQASIDPSVDQAILTDALGQLETMTKSEVSASEGPSYWRIIMKSPMVKMSIAAILLLMVFAGIRFLGGSLDGTSTAFAQICEAVVKAKSVQCIQRDHENNPIARIYEKDGYLTRIELLWDPSPSEFPFDTILMDKHADRYLYMDSTRKVAWIPSVQFNHVGSSLYDLFNNFQSIPGFTIKKLSQKRVESQSLLGFELTQVNTMGQLHCVIWADATTLLPIRMDTTLQTQDGQVIEQSITEIVLNASLDEDLFVFHPKGYQIDKPDPDPGVNRMKSAVKMDRILKACREYSQEHNGQWPQDYYNDLRAYGIDPETFTNPQRGGKLGYIFPQIKSISDATVVIYEEYDAWPEGGIQVGFGNFQVRLITEEDDFKALLGK